MLSNDSNTDGSYKSNKGILFIWSIFYNLKNITYNENPFSDLPTKVTKCTQKVILEVVRNSIWNYLSNETNGAMLFV